MSDDAEEETLHFLDYSDIYHQYLKIKEEHPTWRISHCARALNVSYAYLKNAVAYQTNPETYKHYNKCRSLRKTLEHQNKPKMVSISFQLHTQYKDYFKLQAEKAGIPISVLYREIFDEFMVVYTQYVDRLKTIGFDLDAFEVQPFIQSNNSVMIQKEINEKLEKWSHCTLCNSKSEIIRFAFFYRFLKEHHFL